MPWVRFNAAFDFTPRAARGETTAFKAGHARNVTRECAADAVAKGKAVRIPAPKTRAEAEQLTRGG